MNIDIAITASEASPEKTMHRNVAVIDVFRATSVMITALKYGAKRVIPVTTVEEALCQKKIFTEKGEQVLLGGERNAVLIKGFDKDNSPLAYTGKDIKGRTIVMTTTNGTRAVNNSRHARNIYIAALLNADAVCEKISQDGNDILLVCSGRENNYTLEDALCAGMMTDYLLRNCRTITLSDIAWSLRDIYLLYKDDFRKGLANSRHYNNILKLGLDKDVTYCLQRNITDIVPYADKQFNIVL